MKSILLAIVLVIVCYAGSAQKIKYKDVFPKLHPVQSEEGVTLLRAFLSEEKNREHANANYQMGEYYMGLYRETDVLNDTARLFAFGDSASTFLKKALDLITERELKRNDEYYQAFYRRDLRTGEFGIKISDVRLDLEKKLEAVETQNKNVLLLHEMLQSMKLTHGAKVKSFNSLTEQFDSYEQFLFQLDEDQLENLWTLTDYQDQLMDKSAEIDKLYGEIGQTNPLGELRLEEVSGFETLDEIFDPYQGDYRSWDLAGWVEQTRSKYSADVGAYKSGLMRWDESLELVRERLGEGKASTIQRSLPSQLQDLQTRYDPEGSMKDYLAVKADYLLLQSLINDQINTSWLDSTLVSVNARLADSVVTLISGIKSRISDVVGPVKVNADRYREHIDQMYGGVSAIASSVSQWQSALDDIKAQWLDHQTYWNERNNWTVWEGMRIALDTTLIQDTLSYHTLLVDNRSRDELTVLGVKKEDSMLFVLSVSQERKANWLTVTEMPYVRDSRLSVMPSRDGETVFYTYHLTDSLGIMQMARLDEQGQVLWQRELEDISIPHHLKWDEVIDQYTLYFYPEEAYPLADGSAGYLIISGNGEIK